MVVKALMLTLLLTACTAPAILPDGTNCAYYGISEDQHAPLGCDLDADGMPLVEVVTHKELKGLCGNKGFWDRFAWGCVYQTDTGWRVIAQDKQSTIRHEQCHCLLGGAHNERAAGGYGLNRSVFRARR